MTNENSNQLRLEIQNDYEDYKKYLEKKEKEEKQETVIIIEI